VFAFYAFKDVPWAYFKKKKKKKEQKEIEQGIHSLVDLFLI
jgi:hypothetical protein